jgi:hypothetical protein
VRARARVGWPGRLVEHDERGVHGVGRRRDEVLELLRPAPAAARGWCVALQNAE